MTPSGFAYIAQCEFCGDGLLRLVACDQCGTIAAMCDECELIWLNIEDVADDPSIEASAAFPKCPSCRAEQAGWTELDDEEIREYELEPYVLGRSG